MRELTYEDAHVGLLQAIPELRPSYELWAEDWHENNGESPGQYILFGNVLGPFIEVLLTLPANIDGRDEVLVRMFSFAEEMLRSSDRQVNGLGKIEVAERIDQHPAGPKSVRRLGGPGLRRWFSEHSRDDWERYRSVDIIDLWGAR